MALTLLTVAGCSVSYYGQAVLGQLEIWRKEKPAAAVVGDPRTSSQLRQRLELVREVLAFAESELLLPSQGSYSTYADLGRDSVVWSVFAAPALDVKAVKWSYPVLGALDYRGYFHKERAEAFAKDLRSKGLDVVVTGVPAYSTLGWFRDPLLNTFIDWNDSELAGLIFHELSHRKYYRKGDTEFSEAFAVAVEEEGVCRWLRKRGDRAALERWETRQLRLRQFVQLVLETRRRLDMLYHSTNLPDAEKLTRKREILAGLQIQIRELLTQAGKSPRESFWLRGDLNNAHLNVVAAYRLRVPEFEKVLQANGGDLARFYEAVTKLPSSKSRTLP